MWRLGVVIGVSLPLICHQVLLVIELLGKDDLREHLLTLRPGYVHTHKQPTDKHVAIYSPLSMPILSTQYLG